MQRRELQRLERKMVMNQICKYVLICVLFFILGFWFLGHVNRVNQIFRSLTSNNFFVEMLFIVSYVFFHVKMSINVDMRTVFFSLLCLFLPLFSYWCAISL